MLHTQSDLERARRHLEDGERRIVEQRERINNLSDAGLPTDQSIILLAQMREALGQMRQHLNEIERDVGSRL